MIEAKLADSDILSSDCCLASLRAGAFNDLHGHQQSLVRRCRRGRCTHSGSHIATSNENARLTNCSRVVRHGPASNGQLAVSRRCPIPGARHGLACAGTETATCDIVLEANGVAEVGGSNPLAPTIQAVVGAQVATMACFRGLRSRAPSSTLSRPRPVFNGVRRATRVRHEDPTSVRRLQRSEVQRSRSPSARHHCRLGHGLRFPRPLAMCPRYRARAA